jgi:predicted nicotinamide N-methyase
MISLLLRRWWSIFAVVVTVAYAKEMKLLVSFNRRDVSKRVIVDISTSPTPLIDHLKDSLRGMFQIRGSFDIEVYEESTGHFVPTERIDMNEFVHNKGTRRILLVEHSDNDSDANEGIRRPEVLRISGRKHDLSKGLLLNNTILSVEATPFVLRVGELGQAEKGTGLTTWDGSVVLAKYFDFHPEWIRGKTVLEVGAGTGVVGTAAALMGAKLSVLTDLEYTLENLAHNVDINFKALAAVSSSSSGGGRNMSIDVTVGANSARCWRVQQDGTSWNSVCVKELDWFNSSTYCPDPSMFMSHNNSVCDNGRNILASWDIVVGADVVWLEQLIPGLVGTLAAVCSQSTTLYLSHQVRSSVATGTDLHR